MGILDEIERMDDEEVLKSFLKRIEKIEEENQKLLKEILRTLKGDRKKKRKEGK